MPLLSGCADAGGVAGGVHRVLDTCARPGAYAPLGHTTRGQCFSDERHGNVGDCVNVPHLCFIVTKVNNSSLYVIV